MISSLMMAALAFSLPKMESVPSVDGQVTEAEWKDAHELQRYLWFFSKKSFDAEGRHWIGRDAERFYFAALCPLPKSGLKLKTAPSGGNAMTALWDDGFEFVFIRDAADSKPTFAHLIVNLLGAFYGEGMVNGSMTSWQPDGMVCKYAEKGGLFAFELSLPLKNIHFDGSCTHAIKLCQNWQSKASPHAEGDVLARTCVMPDVAGYVSSTEGADLALDDTAPVVQMTELGAAPTGSFPVRIRIANVTAKSVAGKIHFLAKPDKSQPAAIEDAFDLKPGAERIFETKVPVQGDERAWIEMNVTSPDGKKVYYARAFSYAPNAPLPKFLTVAALREDPVEMKFAYYPSYDTAHAKVKVKSKSEEGKCAVGRIRIADGKGAVVCEREVKFDGKGEADLLWKIADLKAHTKAVGSGEYLCTVTVDGVKDGVAKQKFYRDVFAWEGNAIGKSDIVVPPFTPIEIADSRRARDSRAQSPTGRAREVTSTTGVTVRSVLREHELSSLGLFRQVKCPAKEGDREPTRPILADGGMKLVATVDGKDMEIEGKLKVEEGGSLVKRRWVAHFAEMRPRIAGRVEALFEYDGLMDWRITLEKGRIDSLRLVIPLKGEEATLLHACTDGLRFNYAGEVPAGTGRVWDSTKAARSSIVGDYVPYIWVGGPLRGLAVFGDNDKGWVLGREQKAGGESRSTEEGKVPLSTSTSSLLSRSRSCQEIIREADGTVKIVLNLVQHPVEITEPRTIKVGFMATPVKPMLDDWRAKSHGSLVGCCYYWGGYGDSSANCPYDDSPKFWEKLQEARLTGKPDVEYLRAFIDNYPCGCDPDSERGKAIKKTIADHFNAGMRVYKEAFREPQEFVWYTNGRGLHYGTKEGTTFCDEWDCMEFLERKHQVRWMTAYSMEPVETFLDYAAWWWKKAIDIGAVDHLYWDDIFLCGQLDPVGCDAYRTADGRIQGSSGIFHMRNQVKRGSTVLAECGKDPTGNWIHMTNTAMAPISAFAGVHYDWEDPGSSAPFQERYSRAYMQACTIGRQMGCRVGVIGYCAKTTPENLALFQRSGKGVTLTHELVWGYKEQMDILKAWGYRVKGSGVKVWNYWNRDEAYPLEISGLETSSLAMAKVCKKVGGESRSTADDDHSNEAVVIVSSWKNGDGVALVRPDCQMLGLPKDFKAFNMETGAELTVKDGAVQVPLAKYDFMLIRMK